MDTNKMRELKALAEAATQSHGARRVEVDHNGVHVIGDGSWKILSAWHTPDGKGAQNAEFAAAASPDTVLALLAEIDRLVRKNNNQAESIREYQDLTMGGDVSLGMLKADLRVTSGERDQLKAENEALRKLKLPHFLKLSDEMRAAGDHAEQRALEDQCYSVPVLKGVFFEAAIQRWLDDQEEAIDAAMAKEASHG
ncbi:hypothetical protein [Pseudomonas sp. BJP69]|uniref:hypothetical protein n=1 Tax=Pseudomonas sp. BJP69 TaxID=2597770 RepID=UPI0015B45D15|nr:hypothetical protein [Pseudomonas sp. BJP69]